MKTNNKKEETISLVGAMRKHYVDDDFRTIAEAVELGKEILDFYSDIHHTAELAMKNPDDMQLNEVMDFYISLVIENFTKETFDHNKSNVYSQVEVITALNKEVGLHIKEVLLTSFNAILENEFFQHESCSILLRTMIIEGVTRTANTYVFTFNDMYKNNLIVYANFHAAYHALAMIAFLCRGDMQDYYHMNVHVECYAHEVSKSIAEHIIEHHVEEQLKA